MTDNKNNSGGYNSGDRNSGDRNSGDYNSGFYNSGNLNSGFYNSGNRNSGDLNSGVRNSGHCNSGDHNSGLCNSGDYNSGYFNSNTPKVRIFNIDSDLDFDSYIIVELRYLIGNNFKEICTWVYKENMSDQEKSDNPTYETTGGYLKTRDYKYCWQKFWEKRTEDEKKFIKDLPNFNVDIFKEITGIDIAIVSKRKITLELTEEEIEQVNKIINN